MLLERPTIIAIRRILPLPIFGAMSDEPAERDVGYIERICGPLIVARPMDAAMFELVSVGHASLVGEVVRLDRERVYVQVYDDTTGLAVGDPVVRKHKPLSVELGPGLVGAIFDGIQRPMHDVSDTTRNFFIPRGDGIASLNTTTEWQFTPANFREGQVISGGDTYGTVFENEIFTNHRIMCPPDVFGHVVKVYGEGGDLKDLVHADDPVLEVYNEAHDKTHVLHLSHLWPARRPRPCAEKLTPNRPLTTGIRCLDTLFPAAMGGTCALPGAYGCGKGAIFQSLAKFSNADFVVHVGCGERGNEMAEALLDYPQLTVHGTNFSIMTRTTLVANTSNMPVAAREASIYTGITMAEYFRDQGLHVAMLADSTSRWAEALKEMSCRMGEIPADSEYPAYLGSRLAAFYERAGRVRCLGSPHREGSVTIVGTVSPPGGDLSEPVTAATLSAVQTFWALDKRLAQRKHFPSVSWTVSHSRCVKALDKYLRANLDESYSRLQSTVMGILTMQESLTEEVQLVGRPALTEESKVVLGVAQLIVDDFLAQNLFTSYDCTCPLAKSVGMLKCFVTLYEQARHAVAGASPDCGVTWSHLQAALPHIFEKLQVCKFVDPKLLPAELQATYDELAEDIEVAFAQMRLC